MDPLSVKTIFALVGQLRYQEYVGVRCRSPAYQSGRWRLRFEVQTIASVFSVFPDEWQSYVHVA